jgi:AcrR family transcriptional regulator
MNLTPRQKEIIEVSVALIADHGIQHLTIKNIANELGISEPAIYRHFQSKFDILSAVLDSFQEIAVDVLDNANGSYESALNRIESFVYDRLQRMAANPKLAKVMFSEEYFQDDPRLSDKVISIMHSHKGKIQEFIQQGHANGELDKEIDPNTMFRLIFGPLRLLIKQWVLTGFAFDLLDEGRKLWRTQRRLLQK